MNLRSVSGRPAVISLILLCVGGTIVVPVSARAQEEVCPFATASSETASSKPVISQDAVISQDPSGDTVEEIMREFDRQMRQLRAQMQERLDAALAAERRAARRLAEADRRIQELEQQATRLREMVSELRGESAPPRREPRPSSGAVQLTPADDAPFLGVQLGPVEADIARRLRLDDGQGIAVVNTVPRAPAATVGMQSGDVITHFGGDPVGLDSFRAAMRGKEAGDKIELRYARMIDGAPVRFTAAVTLAKRGDFAASLTPPSSPSNPATPTDPARPAPSRPTEPERPSAPTQPVPTDEVKLGATISDRGDGELEVTEVRPGSNAQAAGLQPGDFILRMGGERVRTIEDIKAFLASTTPGQTRSIRYRRGAERYTVEIIWGAGRLQPKRVGGDEESAADAPKPKEPRARGHLGVALDETDGGLIVGEVIAGSAAELMGIKTGDRLVEFNGTEAQSIDQLRGIFGGLHEGDRVTVVILRSGIRYTLSGKLGAAPGAAEPQAKAESAPKSEATSVASTTNGRPRVGIEVEERAGRLTVVEVEPKSPASSAGMQAGDRIVEFAGRHVRRLEDIGSVLANASVGSTVDATVMRGDDRVEIDLVLVANE